MFNFTLFEGAFPLIRFRSLAAVVRLGFIVQLTASMERFIRNALLRKNSLTAPQPQGSKNTSTEMCPNLSPSLSANIFNSPKDG